MENPADNDYELHELIERRWSPRAFADEAIEDETIRRMLEAARWAPSCYNEQPWSFLVGKKGSQTHDGILECLYDDNRKWARRAPLLMVSVASRSFDYNGEENRHALHDVGLAVENLVLQALDEGVFVHQMAGFDEDRVRTKFSVPGDHVPVACLAAGYPGDPDSLPDELADRERGERTRKSQAEFVYSGKFGETADLDGGS